MTYGPQPTDSASNVMSSAVPDGTSQPYAVAGGPSYSDSGNTKVPVSLWIKDGNDQTKGSQADSAWSLSGSASEIAILKKLALLLQNIAYDNTNELKISLYGKHAAAGDTSVAVDGSGNVMETLATLIAGENLTTNRLNVEPIYSYYVISSASTTTVKSGAGTFHVLNILGGTLGAITVYDNTAGSGTLIVPTFTPGGPMSILLDQSFLTGLTIVTAAATILNIGYR